MAPLICCPAGFCKAIPEREFGRDLQTESLLGIGAVVLLGLTNRRIGTFIVARPLGRLLRNAVPGSGWVVGSAPAFAPSAPSSALRCQANPHTVGSLSEICSKIFCEIFSVLTPFLRHSQYHIYTGGQALLGTQ